MTTREERKKMAEAMSSARLSGFHTENCRVLPNRSELLYRIGSGGVVAEIGAAFGDFTKEIMQRNRPAELHVVDSWDSDRYKKGKRDIETAFAKDIEKGRLKLHQGLSVDTLPKFENDFFDWVYIDTNHSYGTTWKELVLSHAKVKREGRIAGHDFCTGNVIEPVVYGVVQAVSRFCVEYGWQYEFLTVEHHGHFSFCLKRL